jgi:hypothetical protein
VTDYNKIGEVCKNGNSGVLQHSQLKVPGDAMPQQALYDSPERKSTTEHTTPSQRRY